MTTENKNWASDSINRMFSEPIPNPPTVQPEKVYFQEEAVTVHVELLGGSIPMVRIVLESSDSERFGKGHRLEVHFCHFRRYDWCWSFAGQSDPKWDARKGAGFCNGLNVCNGGAYYLPLGYDIEAIMRTTLAAAIQAMEGSVTERILREIPTACRWGFRAALGTAMQVAAPAWKQLLGDAVNDAIDTGNTYFERLLVYRGGRSVASNPITVSGFTPEDCWLNAQYGTSAVVVEGGGAL